MVEICPVCGLPKDICICNDLHKASNKAIVRLEFRKYNKPITIVEGLKLTKDEMKHLTTLLKVKCSSGGTFKNGVIEIQGNHKDKVINILKEEGYNLDG